ncbi:MAG: sulfite exporter TauE/SafE family protein [Gammaproteobacteria bacterium]|nr:sulfite exporter TauE/SafE family protein [Rhodocyclaceae bacterium]MBU3910286.1 sulfite exporter TauE/SafE family protein [Gammaproteobacteria bacterium]MBU4004113.1 sulfite exporter TauE/SafE family protein [Gammaproteobacteria bacterium]MBU4020360.1 sulfite exporter TauE/SafE family protein [Gammaproteobacteria bacterium]MBU4095436.1 sulfite exporter TauE/SafE family protein [Gammaproteobacteria bacterium]
MKVLREFYELMMFGARSYAKWDIDTSQRILHDRRRMAILGLLMLPILLIGVAFADQVSEALPSMLGSKQAYGPAYYTTTIFLASIAVGVVAGLITGCIGAGGGFIIAPALMSAGVKGILAVGTDLFHIFAKAIMGSVLHRKLGNISVSLAVTFLVGSIAGATLGGYINRTLYELNPVLSDTFITTIYVFLLGFLGFYGMADYFRMRKAAAAPAKSAKSAKSSKSAGATKKAAVVDDMTGLAKKVQSVNLPPMIHFDEGVVPGGRKVSAYFLVISGFIVGIAAAIMGVGGGFLTFPIFVYVLGVSASTTVGTDILQIVFTAGYAGIGQYAIYGFIFYTLAMGMLLGSLFGIQIGTLVTKVVSGVTIRGFFALAVMSAFVNRIFALPGKLASMGYIPMTAETGQLIERIGIGIFFVALSSFTVWVFWTFFANIKTLKRED